MLTQTKKFFQDLIGFLKSVSQDERIPPRDKKVILALIALVISPIDLIPDWIPIFGQIDDIVMLAIVLDYIFEVLDQTVILSHYPWGMKSFVRIRRCSRYIAQFTPPMIKNKIWQYKPSVYDK